MITYFALILLAYFNCAFILLPCPSISTDIYASCNAWQILKASTLAASPRATTNADGSTVCSGNKFCFSRANNKRSMPIAKPMAGV